MNKSREIMEIDLLQVISALLKRWWILVLSAILCAAAAFGITVFCIPPLYQSSVLMYVNNTSISVGGSSISISSGELSAAKTLVNTYRVILNTRLTLEEVIQEADLPYSYGELSSMITSSAVNDTEIFRITVTSHDSEEACRIANTIAEVLPDKISDVVEGSSVRLVDRAVVANSPSSPSYSKNAALGLLLGLVLSAGIIILKEFLDDAIRSEDWLTQTFGDTIPLLSVVPDINDKGRQKYGKYSRYGYGYYASEKS